MTDIPKIILQNPFRVLGVFANSPKKEIVANKGKATKFLQVGRDVDYPLDLKAFMPKVERSVDIFNQADAALTIAKGQLKYAQFWFVKSTPLDDVAFNHLFVGDTQQAIEIWNKKDCASSLQNKMVCYYCNGDIDSALNIAEDLYENFSDDFLKIADTTGTLQLTQTDLVQMYLDTLSAEIEPMKIFNVVWTQEWKDYLGSKIVKPIIERIEAAIKTAHDVDDDDANASLRAGNKLVKETKEDFTQLKKILPKGDIQLESIADKLGEQILQCAINYHNHSNDYDRAEIALGLQKSAAKIVMGDFAKERCEDNGNTLQEIIDRLPPREVLSESKNIEQAITAFQKKDKIIVNDIIGLLQNTRADIVSIKEKLGDVNEYYIKISTRIAEIALSNSIRILNDAQESDLPKLEDPMSKGYTEFKLRKIFAASWEIILWISLLDTDAEFKEVRLKPNKDALKEILDNIDAFSILGYIPPFTRSVFAGCCKDVKVDSYTYYTEEELYRICCNGKIYTTSKSLESLAFNEKIKQYDLYLQRYSENKDGSPLSEERLKRIKTIEQKKQQQLEDRRRKEEEKKRQKIEEEKRKEKAAFEACRSLRDYEFFVYGRSKSQYVEQAEEIIEKLRRRRRIIKWLIIIAILIGLTVLVGFYWGGKGYAILSGFIAVCAISVTLNKHRLEIEVRLIALLIAIIAGLVFYYFAKTYHL